MNEEQIQRLDDLTLSLNFSLAILNSALKDYENLEVCILEDFVESLYQNSKKMRKIFDGEI